MLALRLLRGFCDRLASNLDVAAGTFDGFASGQGTSGQQGKKCDARFIHDVLQYVTLV